MTPDQVNQAVYGAINRIWRIHYRGNGPFADWLDHAYWRYVP